MNKTCATLLLVEITLGCTGRIEDEREPGGDAATTDPRVCDSCCVSFTLTPASIDLYRTPSAFSVELTVERLHADGPDSAWSIVATVVTPWGGTQDCTAYIESGNSGYSFIRCPTVAPPDESLCGTEMGIEINVRSRTYANANTSEPACADDLGLTLTYMVPVECPACPSANESFAYEQCDFPTTTQCSYRAMTYGGAIGTLPCNCRPNPTTGQRAWSCAVS